MQQSLQASAPDLDAGPVKFCHAWSVLLFALATVGQATQQPPASVQGSGQDQAVRPVELSSYGDGLLMGAGLLLHLLNQSAWFRLTDLSTLVLQRQQLEYRAPGSNAPAQDFAMFLTRAQAFRSSIYRTLSMLYSFQPQSPPAITVQTSSPGPPVQYPPALTSFAAAPSQTAAVLTSVQAKQQLAWQPAYLPQVAPGSAIAPEASGGGPLAVQAEGWIYGKGPLAVSVHGSHDSDGALIAAGNRQQLQTEYSRSSMATSIV